GLDDRGALVKAAGVAPRAAGAAAKVRLWHPIEADCDEVLAWRRFFEERQIRQPFKQAHREVYLLTDAERRTGTYSNRFAGHVLRQYPLHALCRQRGWEYVLPRFDHQWGMPARALRGGGRAEFWVEVAAESPFSDTGVPLYVATDHVRFTREDGAPQPLEGVPPLLFSEVMRDVGLFVGVASIDADHA